MKFAWIIGAILGTSGICAALMLKSQLDVKESTITGLEAQIAQLHLQMTRLAKRSEEAEQKEQAVETESAQLRALHASAETSGQASPAPAPAASPALNAGFEGILAKMMKDPEMRKAMAQGQEAALRGLYAQFVKDAHLTPDEAAQFFQILEDRQMASMSLGVKALTGGKKDPQAFMAPMQAANAAMQSLLGPDRFANYQAYEKTLGDRVQVQQFGQQLAATETPLQPYQTQALIQIMNEERAQSPAPVAGSPGPTTDAGMAQMTGQAEAINQRVYNRAASILTPEQLTAFGAYQKNALATQKLGLKMSQQMLQGGN